MVTACEPIGPVVPVVPEPTIDSFTMSESSKDLFIGETFQLNANILPTTVTGVNVSWSSSNTEVASVNNGLVTALQEGQTVITASAQDNKYTATCNVEVSKRDAWTIMIYMCGSDLESDSRDGGLATEDIKEILQVAGQPEDINIIIETGGARKWKTTYGINASKLERWHVANKRLVKDASLPVASMGLTSTFQSFLEWGLTSYPAEKTGVILWNHGGAMSGCCFDEISDDSLLNSEARLALKNTFEKLNISTKLEFIGYDCCLMQEQDIAEFNSPYFNYMIAAQEAESGYGWDYDKWVDDLYAKKPTETILKEICDTFIAENDEGGYANDQTLSYLDLSKMEAYLTAWENMAEALGNKINDSNKKGFGNLIKRGKCYAEDEYNSQYYYGCYDVKNFLDNLGSNSTYNPGNNIVNAVKTARDQLVKYSKVGSAAGKSNGLSMVWGISSAAQEIYTAGETNFTKWQALSDTYGGTVSYSYY